MLAFCLSLKSPNKTTHPRMACILTPRCYSNPKLNCPRPLCHLHLILLYNNYLNTCLFIQRFIHHFQYLRKGNYFLEKVPVSIIQKKVQALHSNYVYPYMWVLCLYICRSLQGLFKAQFLIGKDHFDTILNMLHKKVWGWMITISRKSLPFFF